MHLLSANHRIQQPALHAAADADSVICRLPWIKGDGERLLHKQKRDRFGTIVFLTSQDLSALWNRDPAIVLVGLLEFLGYLIIGVLACKASYVFFKRKLTAPKLVERLGIAEFAFETIRSILYAIISGGGGEVWIGVFLRIFAGAIALGVWIAYFEMSRRVQTTFVD